MNADVVTWGPRKKRPYWQDMSTKELQDAINWVIDETSETQLTGGFGIIEDYVTGIDGTKSIEVHLYSGSRYSEPGNCERIGKNWAGYKTLYHYMIVSNEEVTSEEQAHQILDEALGGKDGQG